MFTPAEALCCHTLARLGLEEDLANVGDITSQAVLPPDLAGRAVFVARAPGVVAGLPAVQITFELIDPRVTFQGLVSDGTAVETGTQLAAVSGPMRAILTGERVALNFLQRLSGVATATRRLVDVVADLPCKVLDTRKTTPGWRALEKYAVRQGGGHNHRLGLFDGVLIKDNHLAALGGQPEAVAEAVRLARAAYGATVPLEVEVDTPEQFEAALRAGPDIILLDNMSPEQMAEAVQRRNRVAPNVLLEASGRVTPATLRATGETGVDRISVGALTHSAPALDIGLDYQT
jgi:nicotinate-nucleotide pyrophosphorylase (carboxylating)